MLDELMGNMAYVMLGYVAAREKRVWGRRECVARGHGEGRAIDTEET